MWRISLTMAERPLRRANAQRRVPVTLSIFAEVAGGCSSTFGMASLTRGMHPKTLVAMRYSHFPYLYALVLRDINVVPHARPCTSAGRYCRYQWQSLFPRERNRVRPLQGVQKLHWRIRA